MNEVQPDLVLYNAGVDIYKSDKLGRLSVSWEGMKQRDLHVLSTCVDAGIPVAAVVGGGYDNDPVVVGRRHALVSYNDPIRQFVFLGYSFIFTLIYFFFVLSSGPSCLCTCLEREENVDSCKMIGMML